MIGGIVYREQIQEWLRIKEATLEVARHRKLRQGQLRELHQDARTLQRSRAGPFVREVLESKVMPEVAKVVLKRCIDADAGLVHGITLEWSNFYVQVITTLEAIFVHSQLKFLRVHVLLAVQDALTEYLQACSAVPPNLQQMFLVLQSVPVQFPVSDNQLRFEALTAMAISPFWGLKGLYENRDPHPVIISKELFLRRPANGGGSEAARRLLVQQRPLSIACGYHASTLTELFSLSADRCCKPRMPPF